MEADAWHLRKPAPVLVHLRGDLRLYWCAFVIPLP
jgi:hypothetical protein